MDPSSYGGSPGGPGGGPGYAGGSYGGSPNQGQGGGGYGQEYGHDYGQDPNGSQRRGVTFDEQSVGEQYEDALPPGSDGRPASGQGSGQLYHSAEFPLGANPNREFPDAAKPLQPGPHVGFRPTLIMSVPSWLALAASLAHPGGAAPCLEERGKAGGG